MTDLTALSPATSYPDLLTIQNGSQGIDAQYRRVQDGRGRNSTMTMSTLGVGFDVDDDSQFRLNGVSLTATADVINEVCSAEPEFSGVFPLKLPSGTAVQRDACLVNGSIFYTTDIPALQVRINDAWVTIQTA